MSAADGSTVAQLKEKLKKQARRHEALVAEFAMQDNQSSTELRAKKAEYDELKHAYDELFGKKEEQQRQQEAADEVLRVHAVSVDQVQELCDEIATLRDNLRCAEIAGRELSHKLTSATAALGTAELSHAAAAKCADAAIDKLRLLRMEMEGIQMHASEQEQRRIVEAIRCIDLESAIAEEASLRKESDRDIGSLRKMVGDLRAENVEISAQLKFAEGTLGEQQHEFNLSKRRDAQLLKDLKEALRKETKVREKADKNGLTATDPHRGNRTPSRPQNVAKTSEASAGSTRSAVASSNHSEKGALTKTSNQQRAKKRENPRLLPKSEGEKTLCAELGARLEVLLTENEDFRTRVDFLHESVQDLTTDLENRDLIIRHFSEPRTLRDHISRAANQLNESISLTPAPAKSNTAQVQPLDEAQSRSRFLDFRVDAFIDDRAKALTGAIQSLSSDASATTAAAGPGLDLFRLTMRENLLLRSRVLEMEQERQQLQSDMEEGGAEAVSSPFTPEKFACMLKSFAEKAKAEASSIQKAAGAILQSPSSE